MSTSENQHNKNEPIIPDKHLMAHPTRTMDPPFSLVDRAREIEQAQESVQSHVNGKLDIIVEQIRVLQAQAREILSQAERDLELHRIKCNFEKLVGQPIHLYQKENGEKYFSLLSPADWGNRPPNTHQGSYRLNADRSFEELT